MKSLLPKSHGGSGTRRNADKRKYVAKHLPDVEYRTRDCRTKAEAKAIQDQMLAQHAYIFPT